MIERVQVGLGTRSYTIAIGHGAWRELPAHLEKHPASAALVLTDSRVRDLYWESFRPHLDRSGIPSHLYVVPQGEGSKTFLHLESLCRFMAGSGLDREALVLGLGGGVVGDIAGLAASVYMRGVRFIQLPTTLLSMVDSSVGGKTGINLPEGKNLVGTFYQPEAVLADVGVLGTLDERDWYSGLAEVIKMALALDRPLFEYMEGVTDLSPSGGLDTVKIISQSCRLKAKVVEEDEKESGLRRVLNFGHTLGHGIEAAVGYGGLRHGEAVILGMRAALNYSAKACGLSHVEQERALALLERIPVPDVPVPADLDAFMVRDKKSSGSRITGVFIPRIGSHCFLELPGPRALAEALEKG